MDRGGQGELDLSELSKSMQAHTGFLSPRSPLLFLSALLGPFKPPPPPPSLTLVFHSPLFRGPDLLRNESSNHKSPHLRGREQWRSGGWLGEGDELSASGWEGLREREREEGGWWLFFTQLVLLISISSQGLDAISSLHSAKQNEAKNICDSAQRWRTRTHGYSIQMAYAQSGSGASSIHNAAQAGCRGKRTYRGFGLWHMRLPVLTCVCVFVHVSVSISQAVRWINEATDM